MLNSRVYSGVNWIEERHMPSQLKSDTARANGAKSRGPKSAETKEKSSRNSLRHGFTSRHSILLECENEDEFQELGMCLTQVAPICSMREWKTILGT